MANNRASLPDKRQWGMLITILLMYFFAPTFSSVVSTFSLMPEHYGISPATVSWISSLANPTACVAGLVIGSFAGRRLSSRACAFTAMLLFSVFGALPFAWPCAASAVLASNPVDKVQAVPLLYGFCVIARFPVSQPLNGAYYSTNG